MFLILRAAGIAILGSSRFRVRGSGSMVPGFLCVGVSTHDIDIETRFYVTVIGVYLVFLWGYKNPKSYFIKDPIYGETGHQKRLILAFFRLHRHLSSSGHGIDLAGSNHGHH